MPKIFEFKALAPDRVELWIYSDIGEWEDWGDISAAQINKALSQHAGKNIDLRINSDGGVVTTAMAMYSALKRHDGHITAYIDGIAASAASFVAMAADKIVMPRNSLMMIHNPRVSAGGEAPHLRKVADLLDKMRMQSIEIYAERTGIAADKIGEMLDAETWMTGDEAKALGFADEVTADDVEAYATASQIVFAGKQFRRDKLGIPEQVVAKLERRVEPRAHTPKEVQPMDPKTVEELKAKHPELCAALAAEVHAQATASVDEAARSAVEAERARMQSIDDIAATISPELVAKAKYETGDTAANLALAALKAQAEKGSQYLRERSADAQAIGSAGAVASPSQDAAETKTEERRVRAKSAAERLVAFGGGKLKEV